MVGCSLFAFVLFCLGFCLFVLRGFFISLGLCDYVVLIVVYFGRWFLVFDLIVYLLWFGGCFVVVLIAVASLLFVFFLLFGCLCVFLLLFVCFCLFCLRV